MKLIFSTVFLFISLFINVQKNKATFLNKIFVANIGYIYEETPNDNPCAGLNVYLVLKFTKENLLITEKEVSNCGVENISFTCNYTWKLIENSSIKIYAKSKKTNCSSFIEKLNFTIKNEKKYGIIKRLNVKTEKFEFKEIN